MPDYCLDTSGISNPLENMPEDIYGPLWMRVGQVIQDGKICFNKEIANELASVTGIVGDCIQGCLSNICYEIGEDRWPWQQYLEHVERMRVQYQSVISEYNGDRKATVGLNDISIVGMARTLGIPVISMEKANVLQPSGKRMRIPDVCKAEGVKHLTFNDFLRAEKISL